MSKTTPHPTLEVCCGSLDSAIVAAEAGAARIELCTALEVDGLTPPAEWVDTLRSRYPQLLIHVLVRPRAGDFVYSEAEVSTMLHDIQQAARVGASAIVSGAVTQGGEVDAAVTTRLVEASGALPFTFHRAFDVLRDPFATLPLLHRLGVRRVLTSGGAPTADEGVAVLRRLVEQAAPLPLIILPGRGVNRHNVRHIIDTTGATEIHGSCSATLPDGRRQTSADEVRAVLKSLAS